MPNTTLFITYVGVTLILGYILTKVSQFYGIDTSGYGVYISFYLFIFLSTLVLPLPD